MDGGRVLRAYLAGQMNFVKATELAAQIGKFLAILMSLAGIFLLNIFLVLVALFVYIGAEQEYKMVMVSSLLEGIKVKDIMTPHVKTVHSEATVKEVIDKMFQEKHMGYPVVERDHLKGIITFHDISKIREFERDQKVKNFMTSEVEVTAPDEPLLDSWEKLNQINIGRLPVVENDHLVGIISRTDIMRALEMMKLKKFK
jgi:CBS domain-containing protein